MLRKSAIVMLTLFMVLAGGYVLADDNEVEIPKGEPPVLLTSAGQSPDDEMVNTLMRRIGMEVTHDPLIEADEIDEVKTILIAIGGSAKGLGEAGIDTEEELARIGAILDMADELKEEGIDVLVVGIHIGGEGRRGPISEPSIEKVTPRADFMVVWEEGDEDKFFTDLCEEEEIPLLIIDRVLDLQDVLEVMFEDHLE